MFHYNKELVELLFVCEFEEKKKQFKICINNNDNFRILCLHFKSHGNTHCHETNFSDIFNWKFIALQSNHWISSSCQYILELVFIIKLLLIAVVKFNASLSIHFPVWWKKKAKNSTNFSNKNQKEFPFLHLNLVQFISNDTLSFNFFIYKSMNCIPRKNSFLLLLTKKKYIYCHWRWKQRKK